MIERKHRRQGRGASLVEAIVATGLLSFLFVGAVTIFVAAAQLTTQTEAARNGDTDTASAAKRFSTDAREAQRLALPTDSSGWTPPTGTATSDFVSGGLAAAVELVFPATDASGGWDRGSAPTPPSNTLWVFRADANGTPNAASGVCFWMRGVERGRAVNQFLFSSLDSANVNAAKFSRIAAYQISGQLSCAYSGARGPVIASLDFGLAARADREPLRAAESGGPALPASANGNEYAP